MNPLEVMAWVACVGIGLTPAALVINLTANNIISHAARERRKP